MQDPKNLGTKVGYVVGLILIGCVAAIAVALTVKFIQWLF